MQDEPLLSLVTPVYNGAGYIAENVAIIREELGSAAIPYELIVVSDGSADDTVNEVVTADHPDVRVLHYDRNIGKGYAVKVGLLAARGRYAGFIDSDLDLHPAVVPAFLAAMQQPRLDAAIGSKRHPGSVVDYPLRRRAYSWLYQQLIRLLFQLEVRDTQVGIKLFRRELVDAVVPHLLVKRYAFDLELLAVARDSGFRVSKSSPSDSITASAELGSSRSRSPRRFWTLPPCSTGSGCCITTVDGARLSATGRADRHRRRRPRSPSSERAQTRLPSQRRLRRSRASKRHRRR